MNELTEVGKTISAATAAKLRAARDAIDELLGPATGGDDEEKASEAADAELVGDTIALLEQAVRADGTVPLKIISPGWGASGHYGAAMLERDGPRVFTKGLHMHLDHPTATEEAQRPERSVKDLAATLATDARWDAAGPAGPGLYADANVLAPYREAVNELAPHIGVSIRAAGKASKGEADGRKGNIIEAITSAKSVDFVTVPGAGGQILSLFEAARGGTQITTEAEFMIEQEARELQEAKAALEAEAARLREALLLREARDVVAATLAKVDMPELTRARLADSLAKDPPVRDGALDVDAFTASITDAAKAELAYIAGVSGSGAIRGMGSAASNSGDSATLRESFRRMYLRQGMAADEADQLAASAASR